MRILIRGIPSLTEIKMLSHFAKGGLVFALTLMFYRQGNHLEWLGCALYVAGQSIQLETVEGEAREGNSVSLTQILRATKLK